VSTERGALLLAHRPSRRRQIATALAGHGVAVIAELADPDGALKFVEEREPAMLVVELNPETGDPDLLLRNERVLEFVRAARQRVPGLRVIAVADSFDPGLVANAVANGVDAYLLGPDAS
jgi:DNA-binding NarL/FixJ family response regulator